MVARTVYIVRHGETVENQHGIHQGRAIDGPITAQGALDVERTAQWLSTHDIDMILTGPMRRARQTADILAARTGTSVRLDERLAAKVSGTLSGRPRALAAQRADEVSTPVWEYREPGAESSVDVQRRHLELWHELPERGNLVLVGHGCGIACLILGLSGLGFERFAEFVHGSAHITAVTCAKGRIELAAVNQAPTDLC